MGLMIIILSVHSYFTYKTVFPLKKSVVAVTQGGTKNKLMTKVFLDSTWLFSTDIFL